MALFAWSVAGWLFLPGRSPGGPSCPVVGVRCCSWLGGWFKFRVAEISRHVVGISSLGGSISGVLEISRQFVEISSPGGSFCLVGRRVALFARSVAGWLFLPGRWGSLLLVVG